MAKGLNVSWAHDLTLDQGPFSRLASSCILPKQMLSWRLWYSSARAVAPTRIVPDSYS